MQDIPKRPEFKSPTTEETTSALRTLCEAYIELCETGDTSDTDLDHYIFEAAMTLMCGPEVWAYINAQLSGKHSTSFLLSNDP